MNKKKIELLTFIIIILFTFNIFGIIFNNYQIPNTTSKNSRSSADKDTHSEDITDEELINVDLPKTADISQEQQEHNFSLSINIEDAWNQTWSYLNYNSTKAGSDIMFQPATAGFNVSYEFYISDLTNKTSGNLIFPSNLTTMNLSVWLGVPTGLVNLGLINDLGLGRGYNKGYIELNETLLGIFIIQNVWTEDVNVTYNATMTFTFIPDNYNITTKFTPTVENTQSNKIKWEFNLQKSPLIYLGWDYYIKINLNEEFTLVRALGTDDTYWKPVETIRTQTEIILNETYNNYLVEVESLNYVSIVYNDNLSFDFPTYANNKNELQLYATCKMAGNLTIQFQVTNGTIFNYTKLVVEDEVVFFNYAMPMNATGGIASLNVTLSDSSPNQFGIKVCEVLFHKNTVIDGQTSNTTAFSQFFVAMAYIDYDLFMHYLILNSTGQKKIYGLEILNYSVIPNATVTYELGEFKGELTYQLLGPFYGAPNVTVYWDLLDLSEYQIVPGEYNLTYIASRPGYQSLEFITLFVIEQKEVVINITSVDDTVAIEEEFLFVLKLYENETMQPYLMTPVSLNFTFTNNDTGEVEIEGQWPEPAIQAITIQDTMNNETPPGIYNLTFKIDSEYYYGETSWFLTIEKKVLDISVDHDISIRAGSNTNFTWSLEDNNFQGNRVNMSMQIIVDGQLFTEFNLTSNSTGSTIFNFAAGKHNITYRLISMFYEAEETVIIQALAAVLPDDDDDDDDDEKEENILFLMIITLILIGVSILAIFMVISRHKVKAQRELESELIALKTKTSATEQKISLIETQISEIASIYWVLVVHSEQGVTLVEIADFKFEDVIGEEQKELIGKGMLRDSALIGGFLTAIRNFSRETSGTSLDYHPVFNSQTDYSTIVNDNEIHRRILEGTHYFMAFVSSRGTMEISDVLSFINSKFELAYGEAVKNFDGAVSPFKSFEEIIVEYLHKEIRELQNKLSEERIVLEQHDRQLREVQEKIGIKPKKLK